MNFGKVMELKNKELKRLSDLYKGGLDNAGVTFIEGRGEITGPNSVKVNGKEYKVRSTPSAPCIPFFAGELAGKSVEIRG